MHPSTAAARGAPSGLPGVGEVRWGTHLCQFYQSAEDLAEVLVPYFAAGLANGERCLWVTSEPYRAKQARAQLAAAVPDFDGHLGRGDIEIIDHEDWYLDTGQMAPEAVVEAWLSREREALRRGYKGLRLTGNTYWLERRDWADFVDYEAMVHRAFHGRHIIGLCSYCLQRCAPGDIIDVVRNHRFALVRRDGAWQMVQSAASVMADGAGAAPVPPHNVAPMPAEPPRRGHDVRFYQDDDVFVASAAAFLGEGLRAGEAVMACLTSDHLERLRRALEASGVSLSELVASGRAVLLDANQTLPRFYDESRPGHIDLQGFQRHVATAVDELQQRFGPLRLVGEMVDVLVEAGDVAAAVSLEDLWNQLSGRMELQLLCGYRIGGDRSGELSLDSFRALCATHWAVHPDEEPGAGLAREKTPEVTPGRLVAELQHTVHALDDEARRRRQLEVERGRLFEAEREARARAREAAEHLARLQRVTSALSEAASPEDIAAVVATDMAGVVGAKQALLVAPIEGLERLSLLGHAGLTAGDASSLGSFATTEQIPAAQAYRTGRAVWLESRETIDEAYPGLELPPATAAIAAVPLELGERRFGAMAFGFDSPRTFPAPVRALLDDLARQAALAMDRARLYEQVRKTRDRLQLLAEASARLSHAPLDLDQVLDSLVDATAGAFADEAVVALRSDDDSRLDVIGLRGIDPAREDALRRTLARAPLEVGDGIAGSVAATGQAALVPDVGEHVLSRLKPEHREHLQDHPRASMVCVPLSASAETIGVLAATRTRPDAPFTAEDQALLQEVADRASLAISRARLYERSEYDRRAAEEANRAKDEFLAMLGHELRNPLSPILTALQLMRLRGGDAFLKERTIIDRQVQHMVRLVDDLLDVSRITRGKVELDMAPVDLAEVVTRALETASPLIEQRAHHVSVSVPAGLTVHGDEHRLGQIVANLLTNAAKYTPEGGHLEVYANADGDRVRLTVRDDGIGIERALLPRIFDTFTQGRRTLARSEGGLGLGLAIVRTLVDMHGGRVFADSPGTGLGSQFSVELPLLQSHTSVASRARRRRLATAPPADSWRILIVDDNEDAAAMLDEALQAAGHRTCVAHDGPAALDAAAPFRPHLALLDIGLPVMDGYELGRRLQALLADAPPALVAITGYGLESDRARSRRAGFAEHLVKPLDVARLEAVIDELLGQPRRRAAAR